MTTYIRPAAVARDDADMVTGWNISPNTGYQLQISATSSGAVVILLSVDGSTLIGSGVAAVGTAQPVTITPMSGQAVGMADTSLGWHILLTTAGTEGDRTITMDAMVDLSARTHPVYVDDDLALAVAAADINAGTHYTQDVTALCPLVFGASVGDMASVPVDGSAVVGQVESVTWTGTPDGSTAQAVIRAHIPIRPEAYTPPVVPTPPVVVDDAGTTDAATTTSGNVLANDSGGTLTVSAVNGLSGNVGQIVAGSNGGEFVVTADGAWTFDPAGDFSALTGSDTATTSVAYHASNGMAEASATLTVTVSAVATSGDPMWADVVMLVQAPESGTAIADATGKSVTVNGGAAVNTTLGYPSIYFDGNGDSFYVGAAGNYNLLHNGTPWTIDFVFRPSRGLADNIIIDTVRGTSAASGIYLSFAGANKLQFFVARGVYGSFVVGSTTVPARTFDYTFALDTEVHAAVDLDLSRTTNHARLYVNGVHVASLQKTSYTPSTDNSAQLLVGMFDTSYPVYAYQGHIRVLRITAGLRDVSTPPSWPYPTA